jgi:hypothetical protein
VINQRSKRVPESEGQQTEFDTYFKILSGIQDQIRFADSKAAFIAALNALLFGFFTSGVGPIVASTVWVKIFAGLYALAAVGSVIVVITAVISRFGDLAPQSKVFFGHITKQYGKDYERYVRETINMTDKDWAKQVGNQIVEVSHIACCKHQLVRKGAICTLVAIVLWFMTLILAVATPMKQ